MIKWFYSVILTQNNGIFIKFCSTPHIIIFILIQYISNGRNNYGQIGDSSIVDKKEFTCISKSRIAFSESPIKIKGISE